MAYRGSTARARAPLQARSRRRWLLAAGIAGLWLVFLMGSGSLVASTTLLVLLGAVATGVVVVLRLFGFGRDHPWFHRAASRPWRDGRDVLRVALGHLSEVFIVTPQGSLLAPNAVELRMNPDDIESLAELIDLSLVNASAAEAYAAEVAAHSARVVSNVPLEVGVVADPAVPPGRYRLRQRASLAAMTLAADPVTSADLVTGADPVAGAARSPASRSRARTRCARPIRSACQARPVRRPRPACQAWPAWQARSARRAWPKGRIR